MLLMTGALLMAASPLTAQETGSIQGMIVGAGDQQTRVGQAAVFLCDAKTGRPLAGPAAQPLGAEGVQVEGLSGLTHAVTDDRGHFEFKDVPVGKYRLVAQSWLGFAGVPERKDPSEIVFLHGVADDVEVTENATPPVFIRPLGTARMTLVNDPEEPHAFLVLSTAPLHGDPVLGPLFWGDNFAKHAIGITLMETPHVTFHGLPEKELHAGLFNYDNNPGVGGATFTAKDSGTARIPIYASWSNGLDEPPKELLALVEHLETKDLSAEALLKPRFPKEFAETKNRRDAVLQILRDHGDKKLTVEGVGEFRILDIAAADTYRRLRESHKARRERAAQSP
jgi:hypothetical protein